jgi:hypothetical protein
MGETEEFLQRADVAAALKEHAGVCFEQIEGEEEPSIPDLAEFLRDKGIEPPPSATLRVSHTVHEADVQPQGPICEDGTRAIPTDCQWVKGSMHCVWVCP